jgi:hypothetical protein
MTIDEAWDRWLNAQPTMTHAELKAAKTAFYAAFAAGAGEHGARVGPVIEAARMLAKYKGSQGLIEMAGRVIQAVEEYDREKPR